MCSVKKDYTSPVKCGKDPKEAMTMNKSDGENNPATIEASKSLDSKLPKYLNTSQKLNNSLENKVNNEEPKIKKSRQHEAKYSSQEKMIIAKELIMKSRNWLKWARSAEQEDTVVRLSLNKSCDNLKNEIWRESNTLPNKNLSQSLIREKERSFECEDNKSLKDVVLKTSTLLKNREIMKEPLKGLEENFDRNSPEGSNEDDIYQLVCHYFEQEKQKDSDKVGYFIFENLKEYSSTCINKY